MVKNLLNSEFMKVPDEEYRKDIISRFLKKTGNNAL
jgi:hypothetical protein